MSHHITTAAVRIVAVAALLATGACGSSGESAAPSPTSTSSADATTGDAIEGPDEPAVRLDPAADDPPAGAESSDDDAVGQEPGSGRPTDGENDRRETADAPPTGAAHPLETIVIDTVVADAGSAPVLDEPASLACANTEFAMDALIEGAPDHAEHFAMAAEWADDSSHGPIRDLADRLAGSPTGDEANELVVTVLQTCAAAGYEL